MRLRQWGWFCEELKPFREGRNGAGAALLSGLLLVGVLVVLLVIVTLQHGGGGGGGTGYKGVKVGTEQVPGAILLRQEAPQDRVTHDQITRSFRSRCFPA